MPFTRFQSFHRLAFVPPRSTSPSMPAPSDLATRFASAPAALSTISYTQDNHKTMPLVQFRAGRCERRQNTKWVDPQAGKG